MFGVFFQPVFFVRIIIIFVFLCFSKRGKKGEKGGKGLRHFSMKVCEKVQLKGVTSYNEVADELVTEFSDPRNMASPSDGINVSLQSRSRYTNHKFSRIYQNIDCYKTIWRQRVSFLTIRMVLNHMSDAI